MRDAYLGDLSPTDRTDAPGRDVVVCASGRLTYARRPDAFVRLAQRLSDSRNRVRCVWIGDGEMQPLIEEMIRDLGLTGKLEVTGWLPHAQALRRIAEADIFVHYSRWDAIPNAVLEAMAAGLPVVASDIPGNRGLVRSGRNGFLAAAEPELLERTLELIDDPALRARLGQAGKRMVQADYSKERLMREITGLYAAGAKSE